jgi:TM2 domain-containing membrane protein YozV
MKFIKKSYLIAYLLLLIFPLGLLGLHRFYLGRTGTGLIYFFTGGLCLFGWFFDLFYTYKMVNDYNFEVEKSLQIANKQ